MRLLAWVAVVGVVLGAGCGDDDDAPAGGDSERTALVAESLTANLLFEDGVVELGEIPEASEQTVSLKQEDQVLSLEPDDAQIMALTVDNPNEEDDPVVATLMQFEGDDDRHIEVPKKSAADGGEDDGAINISFMVDGDVCSKLCNDSFTINMIQAVKLKRGGVSKHLRRMIKLDCSKKGDPKKCGDEPSGGKSGSDGGTASGSGGKGSGTSGSTSMQTPAQLSEEFGQILAMANLALCNCLHPGTMPMACEGFLPQTSIGSCIKPQIESDATNADLAPLNELAQTIKNAMSACTSCDLTTCDPNLLYDALPDLSDGLQAGFKACGVMESSAPDAGTPADDTPSP